MSNGFRTTRVVRPCPSCARSGFQCPLTVDELLNKLALEVLDISVVMLGETSGSSTHNKVESRGTAVLGLLLGDTKVLLLADIGHEGYDLVALVNEPCKDT